MKRPHTRDEIRAALLEARQRTLMLIEDLTDEQLMGPQMDIVNPMRWEVGHVGWFLERWALRELRGRTPVRADGDALYDSSAVHHDTRWDLPLPDRAGTLDYLQKIFDEVVGALDSSPDPLTDEERYFHLLPLLHEDMHAEAFAYMRHTHAYPAPAYEQDAPVAADAAASGDVEIPGGAFDLGSPNDGRWVFDNEKWAHPVDVQPFRLARTPTTEGQFAAFVDDDGYGREDLWSPKGWAWRCEAAATAPRYWRRETAGWAVRWYDAWRPLDEDRPVLFVNWHEAKAWCRWAERRLPTEAEWELAARGRWSSAGELTGLSEFPWGDEPIAAPTLDARQAGPPPVSAWPEGDTPLGLRHMAGGVWEWTDTDFAPFPGFSPDPYTDYSQPWFHTHKVLKGGCWVTRGRLLRSRYRNFYEPHRGDVWCGFRSAAD